MPSHFMNVVQNPLSLENPVAKAISRTGRAADWSRKTEVGRSADFPEPLDVRKQQMGYKG